MRVLRKRILLAVPVFLLLLSIGRGGNARELVDASSDNFPPVNFLDGNGDLTGFGHDISQAVARAVGTRITHIHTPRYPEAVEWLESGKADLIHDTAYSEERDRHLDFSDPILVMQEAIFVRTDQYNINGLPSLYGKRVACVRNHISHQYLRKIPEIQCVVVDTPVEAIFLLLSEEVEAFVYPKQIMSYLAQEMRLSDKFKIVGEPLRELRYCMVVLEGNREVLGLLNEGIGKIRATGEYDRIYDKWFGTRLFAGYTKKELTIFLGTAAVLSLLAGFSLSLLFANARLRRTRSELSRSLADLQDAKEALSRTYREFESILSAIPDILFMIDLEGNLLRWNKAVETVTGFPPEKLKGKSALYWIAEEDHPAVLSAIRESVERGEKEIEARMRKRDGVVVPYHWKGVPLKDDAGNVIGVTGIGRDLSERKALESELLKSQKLESVGILAGGIAHDFNNLLTAILGNISLVKSATTRTESVRARLDEAEKAAHRARDLTRQLLTFSRGGTPVRTTASVQELIRESTSFVLRGANIRCEFSFSPALSPVEVDPGQISQVIHNLILNAVQAMPGGGVIRVSGENVRLGAGEAVPLPPGDYVRICVEDQGIGIPPELLGKVFDPYFSTKERGNGLGLATAYSIITKHNGHIAVEARRGGGTVFRIDLPASKNPLAPAKAEEERKDRGRGRILVMDDEESVRNVTGQILASIGYQVTLAREGEEAIALYRQSRESGNPFDAVIMDLTVPGGMGGKETVRRLLEIDPGVKAIVSSGYSSDPVMAHYREYGFSGFVSKPYSVQHLRDAIRTVLPAHPVPSDGRDEEFRKAT